MLYMLKDIVRTIIKSFPDGFVIGLIITMIITLIKDKSLSNYIKKLDKRSNRLYLYLTSYTYMMLYRTVICRPNTYKPLSDVFGGWGIVIRQYTGIDYGTIIGNTLLFLFFTLLLNITFKKQFSTKKKILITSTVVSFGYSLFIELLQLITSRGTFQISDLVYNTLGGFLGAVIYILIQKKRKMN